MRGLVVLLLAATVGAVAAETDWWQTALIYQIYPRSYMDSDGDGIGDLNGITSKLPYIQGLGADAIWLSPIYKSPMYDFGYDIADYKDIADEYGTMADFDNLMTEAQRLGVRVILDFVPNHTSNESEWFVRSAERNATYNDYYVWADGVADPDDPTNQLPPNNWVSIFRKSAWQYNPTRGQYYLHQFVIGQPDLNYRSSELRDEMKNVLRFWLDKGVSGFRVDAVNMLYEVDPADFGGKYPDEPESGIAGLTKDDYDFLNHIYTKDLDETYAVVYDWRDVLDEYKHIEYKIMMTEAYTDLNLMIKYYGNGQRNGSIPFNFSFLGEITKNSNAKDMKHAIDRWMTYMPYGMTANWVNGNHDQSRLATRHGDERVDALNMLAILLPGVTLTYQNGNHDQSRLATRHGDERVDALNMLAILLPGVTLTYQGEELGMTDGYISWEETVDPQACNTDDPVNGLAKSRDPCRTPFHWDASANAGFSTAATTWLPVASNYATVNVAVEMSATKSHYHFYRDVVSASKTPAVREGDLETRAISIDVLAIARLLPGEQAIVGLVNLSSDSQTVDLSSFRTLPYYLDIVTVGVASTQTKGTRVTKKAVTISAQTAIVLQSVARVPRLP